MVAKNSFFLNQPTYGLSTNRGVGNGYDLISALVIQRHLHHDASKEAMNPLWSWIHSFGSFDELCSELSCITDPDSDHPKREQPLNVSVLRIPSREYS